MPQRSGSLTTAGLVGLASELLERVDAAVLAVDLEGRILYANRFAERLYGRSCEELVGQLSDEVNGVTVAPALQSEIAEALRTRGSWEGTFDVHRKDGTKLTVHTVDSPLYDKNGQMVGVVTLATDATRERIEQFLAECSIVLGSTLDYEANLAALARLVVPYLGDICFVDVADGDGIRRVAAVHADPDVQPLLDELAEKYPPDPNGPHPAVEALNNGQSAYLAEITDEVVRALSRSDDHYRVVSQLGFRSYMCVPLTARDRVLGAVTIISCDPNRRFGPPDVDLMLEVASRASAALDNALLFEDQQRARAAAEDSAERLSQLQMLSTALSRAVTVTQVTKVIGAIALPALNKGNRGLWLVDEESQRLELVEGFDLRGLEPKYLSIPLDSDLPAAEVVRTREPIVIGTSSQRDERFPDWKPDEDEGASFAAVPLIAEERTLGVFALGYENGYHVSDDELRFLTAIADQCAQALARGYLYDRARQERDRAERDRRHIQELNHALQTSLLPPALPEIPGVDLAARYQPALAGLEVGGDFYDAFDTGGDWALVVGDVCGKGPEAAAVTAIARWTIRSVAMDIRQPTQVLRKVNEALVHQQLDDRFCTIAYARVVPSSQGVRVSVSRGGHPAPLVIRSTGDIEPIGTSGSLIGILSEIRVWEETTHLQPGDSIVFYTDGVTEARRGREQFGEERLAETLSECSGKSADEIADHVQGAVLEFAGNEPSDDIAMLVLRVL